MPSRLFFSEREIAWFDVNHQLPPAVPSHVLPIRVYAKPIIILSNEIVGERCRARADCNFDFASVSTFPFACQARALSSMMISFMAGIACGPGPACCLKVSNFEFPCFFVSSWFADTDRHRMTRTEKRKKRSERCEMFPSIEGGSEDV